MNIDKKHEPHKTFHTDFYKNNSKGTLKTFYEFSKAEEGSVVQLL